MSLHLSRIVTDIVNERSLKNFSGLMSQCLGERLENRQVGGTFKVKDPTRLFGQVVVLEPNFLESLQHLAAAVVNAMGFADERNNNVPAGGLIQDDLGMACGDDLRTLACCKVSKNLINLSLPQDLQMSVGFIKEQNCSPIGIKMSKKKEGLLKAAARR